MAKFQRKASGFTLIEVILVLIILSSVLVLFLNYTAQKGEQLRIDKTVLNFQQVLNAALAFYVDNGRWPNCTNNPDTGCWLGPTRTSAELIEKGYIPSPASLVNFWPVEGISTDYLQSSPVRPKIPKNFGICFRVPPGAYQTAEIIASRIPMGKSSQNPEVEMDSGEGYPCNYEAPIIPCDGTANCYVMGYVNIPGQNLNNARSINFAGIYYNGACVPAPVCPEGTSMKPQIIVSPASVSGLYEGYTPGTDNPVFPISSFTAFAKGDPSDFDKVPSCTDTAFEVCNDKNGDPLPTGKYWRVCLEVITAKGKISGTSSTKESGSISVTTRCVPEEEPAGGTDVFLPYL